MINMQTFYTMLTESCEERDAYRDVLVALTRADHDQISTLESDLAWQQWTEQVPKQANA